MLADGLVSKVCNFVPLGSKLGFDGTLIAMWFFKQLISKQLLLRFFCVLESTEMAANILFDFTEYHPVAVSLSHHMYDDLLSKI